MMEDCKGLAESAATTPAPNTTEMKEKDTLIKKLKELLIPVDSNKPLDVKTASIGIRG